jgi:hypothetical protein
MKQLHKSVAREPSMLDVVIGRSRNLFGQQQLRALLADAPLTGTLYLAYPIIASSDQMIVVDSLLTSREHGVVVIDFLQFEDQSRTDGNDSNEIAACYPG